MRRTVPMVVTAVAAAIVAIPLLATTSQGQGVREPLPGPDGVATFHQHVLYAVSADSPRDAWAVGDHYVDINFTATRIKHWDGQSWHAVPSPSPSHRDNILQGVAALSPHDVWAVGGINQRTSTLTEHWDGSTWSVVPSPNHRYSALLGVSAVAPDDIWAVGEWSKYSGSADIDDGTFHTLVEHWDGSAWTEVPSPDPDGAASSYLSSVSALSADDVWAVGSSERRTSGITESAVMEHWDGSSWQIVARPHLNPHELVSVSAVAPDDVWAVGYVFTDDFLIRGLIEHWDGRHWTVVKSANRSRYYTNLSGVSANAADDVWAVGASDRQAASPSRPHIEHWDGSRWSSVPSPSRHVGNGSLASVSAVSSTAAWAVGTNYRQNTSALIQHWDGASWTEQR